MAVRMHYVKMTLLFEMWVSALTLGRCQLSQAKRLTYQRVGVLAAKSL
jgi:hypothetical protein